MGGIGPVEMIGGPNEKLGAALEEKFGVAGLD
jgi:hypothetical protein